MNKRFALVWCSQKPPSAMRYQTEATFIRDGEHWDVLLPGEPDFLRKLPGYDGYVLSGSEKSVVKERETPFISALLEGVATIEAKSSAPIFGICFGAQALAAALGGRVGRNPSGTFRLGVETISWKDAVDPGRWPESRELPALVASHGECVAELPPGSTVLASSPSTVNEIYLTQDRFLGVQCHPELDHDALRGVLMRVHRPEFDDAGWAVVEREAGQVLRREGVLEMARRLLRRGRL